MFNTTIVYIFFIVSSLFFLIASIYVVVAGFYVIKILRNISKTSSSLIKISETLKERAANISNILTSVLAIGEKIIDIVQEKHKRKKNYDKKENNN